MKYVFLSAIICIAVACGQRSYPRFDYNYTKEPWINAFKDRVFFSALQEAYKSDTLIFQLIDKKDAFNPYDGLMPDAMEKANELGKTLINKMPPPVMCESCRPGENYYMAASLHYYNSKELDSIARLMYKAHVKKENLYK